jgi:hypothetical protein
MTRAFQKLQDVKNAATLAIAILTENEDDECYGNIFSENFDKNHCKNCRDGIRNFLHMPGLKKFLQHLVPLENNNERVYEGARANKDAEPGNLIQNDADQENDADQLGIATIKECLRDSLLSIASKLLSCQHLTLDILSQEEQDLWNSYENADIYKFLTGEKDTLPKFQFDWITTDPKLCFPTDWKDLIVLQPQNKPPQQPQPQQPQPQLQQVPPPQPQPQAAQTPPTAPACTRVLSNKPPVDFKELHTGIKRKCKLLRRKPQAVVTKLAPGAFSPWRDGSGDGPSASTSASQQ